MDVLEVHQFLFTNKYVTVTGGKMTFTKKWREDLLAANERKLEATPEATLTKTSSGMSVDISWMDKFCEFIIRAEVPKQLQGTKGQYYVSNAATKEAAKVYQSICLKTDVSDRELVEAVKGYYRSKRIGFKKTISNFFVQGDWRAIYDAWMQNKQQNTQENPDDDGKYSGYSMG